ncbi:iron-sulfur cluster biosynthesis family protein [Sporolactobacillus vineae]|uniref:iron-sulfur cluster biosynthesis family protein n=1 Tax=Sporolactobacillus vineae TaxID=444463 RepID=UPI00028901DF|nr:iron-sulfur cluster biosynthesis family protein [Sporolactobacillus vineae]
MLKVTDEAKEMLNQSMKAHQCDCLRVFMKPGCCGMSLNFGLDTKKPEEQATAINGVPVIMDGQAQQETDGLTISVDEGKLVIDGGSCGCGSSGCC